MLRVVSVKHILVNRLLSLRIMHIGSKSYDDCVLRTDENNWPMERTDYELKGVKSTRKQTK